MRKKIARTVFEKTCGGRLVAWSDETRDYYLAIADAVLDALSEPTEEMVEAGVKDHPYEQSYDGAEATWRTMIAAARNPS